MKIDVLPLRNHRLRAPRVQNENMSERENQIFRKRAGSPACGGGVYEEQHPRAARRKFVFRSRLVQNVTQNAPSAKLKRKSFTDTLYMQVAFVCSIQGCTLYGIRFVVSFPLSITEGAARCTESALLFRFLCQLPKALDGINKSHLHAQCVCDAIWRGRPRERRA